MVTFLNTTQNLFAIATKDTALLLFEEFSVDTQQTI